MSVGEGPTGHGQGKGTLLVAPWSPTFVSKAFLSSIPPTPPANDGFLQTSGKALVWKADALHGLSPTKESAGDDRGRHGRHCQPSEQGQSPGAAKPGHCNSALSLVLSPCPRTTPQSRMIPDTLHTSLSPVGHFQV